MNRILGFSGLDSTNEVDSIPVSKSCSAAAASFRRVVNRIAVSPNSPGKINRFERLAVNISAKKQQLIPSAIHKRSEEMLIHRIKKQIQGKFIETKNSTIDVTGIGLASLNYETYGHIQNK